MVLRKIYKCIFIDCVATTYENRMDVVLKPTLTEVSSLRNTRATVIESLSRRYAHVSHVSDSRVSQIQI